MPQHRADRPYIQSWLKRVGRQLSGSGRMSQISFALTQLRGGELSDWNKQLREILDGSRLPDPELITDIDRLLGIKAPAKPGANAAQPLLF